MEEAKIIKTFILSNKRTLTIDNDFDVFIRDSTDNNKKAFFTAKAFRKTSIIVGRNKSLR